MSGRSPTASPAYCCGTTTRTRPRAARPRTARPPTTPSDRPIPSSAPSSGTRCPHPSPHRRVRHAHRPRKREVPGLHRRQHTRRHPPRTADLHRSDEPALHIPGNRQRLLRDRVVAEPQMHRRRASPTARCWNRGTAGAATTSNSASYPPAAATTNSSPAATRNAWTSPARAPPRCPHPAVRLRHRYQPAIQGRTVDRVTSSTLPARTGTTPRHRRRSRPRDADARDAGPALTVAAETVARRPGGPLHGHARLPVRRRADRARTPGSRPPSDTPVARTTVAGSRWTAAARRRTPLEVTAKLELEWSPEQIAAHVTDGSGGLA